MIKNKEENRYEDKIIYVDHIDNVDEDEDTLKLDEKDSEEDCNSDITKKDISKVDFSHTINYPTENTLRLISIIEKNQECDSGYNSSGEPSVDSSSTCNLPQFNTDNMINISLIKDNYEDKQTDSLSDIKIPTPDKEFICAPVRESKIPLPKVCYQRQRGSLTARNSFSDDTFLSIDDNKSNNITTKVEKNIFGEKELPQTTRLRKSLAFPADILNEVVTPVKRKKDMTRRSTEVNLLKNVNAKDAKPINWIWTNPFGKKIQIPRGDSYSNFQHEKINSKIPSKNEGNSKNDADSKEKNNKTIIQASMLTKIYLSANMIKSKN